MIAQCTCVYLLYGPELLYNLLMIPVGILEITRGMIPPVIFLIFHVFELFVSMPNAHAYTSSTGPSFPTISS